MFGIVFDDISYRLKYQEMRNQPEILNLQMEKIGLTTKDVNLSCGISGDLHQKVLKFSQEISLKQNRDSREVDAR